MKMTLRWTLIPGAVLALACQDRLPNEDLRSDLALLDAASLELAPALGASADVVSSAEKVSVPGPRSAATPKKKRAPQAPPPQPAEAAASEDEAVTAPRVVTVSPSETPTAVDQPAPESAPAIRPQPIEPRYPVGTGAVYGVGTDREAGGGGVVIRGGRTGRDPCAIHDSRGRLPAGGVLINNRIPSTTTFPRR